MDEKENSRDPQVDDFIKKEIIKYLMAILQMTDEIKELCDYMEKKGRAPTRAAMIAARKKSLEMDNHSKIFRRNTLKVMGKIKKGRFPMKGFAV